MRNSLAEREQFYFQLSFLKPSHAKAKSPFSTRSEWGENLFSADANMRQRKKSQWCLLTSSWAGNTVVSHPCNFSDKFPWKRKVSFLNAIKTSFGVGKQHQQPLSSGRLAQLQPIQVYSKPGNNVEISPRKRAIENEGTLILKMWFLSGSVRELKHQGSVHTLRLWNWRGNPDHCQVTPWEPVRITTCPQLGL